jgi:class 3 adenylate cyclase
MRHITILIAFIGLSLAGFAQTDSLIAVYSNLGLPDTTRLNAAESLASHYMRVDPDSCLYYSQQMEKLAVSARSEREIAQAFHLQGVSHYFKNDAEKAIEQLTKAVRQHRKNKDRLALASSLNVIGAVHMQQGNHAKAMIHYMECLKLSESLNDKRGIAGSSHNIGRIHSHKGNKKEALKYYLQSLENRSPEDKRGIASELDVIGSVHADMDNDSLALDYFHKALEMRQKLGDQIGVGMSLGNIGQFHLERGNLKQAMEYIQQSLKAFESAKDKQGIAMAHSNLSHCHYLLKQYEQAIEAGTLALQIAQELEIAEYIKLSAERLFLSYKAIDDNGKALEMYELHIIMKDSIASEENEREVLNQEYKYQYEKEALTDSLEFAKKEAVLVEQTAKQRIGLAAAGGGLGLVLLLAFSIHKGKKKSDELLLNILPEETAKELKEKGHSDAQLIDEVTVLFTDFKGFTALSEQMSPKDLVRDIHECFSEFDRIMAKHGIEKIKTIGDAYMAAGGLPIPNATHAIDVVNAALEIKEFVELGKADKIKKGLPYFEIRIGVHTGPVVAGIVGIKKFQYDIWGDTVNTASRMESSGEVGRVNVSETTYNLIKDQFHCEARGAVEAKGKGSLNMYFVQ